VAEVLAEVGDLLAGLILDYYAIAGVSWVAAGAAVAVSDEVVLRRILTRRVFTLGKERFGSGAAWVGHANEFTTALDVVSESKRLKSRSSGENALRGLR
jgi:hypothetical protein